MARAKRTVSFPLGERVSVEWYDAYSQVGWGEEEGKAPPFCTIKLCETVGWILRANTKEIVVAGSRHGDVFGDFTAIPATWQIKVRKLEPV